MPIIYKGLKEDRLPRSFCVSTGIKELDTLPFRLRVGVLSLIYGASGAGKTTMAGYIPIIKIAQYFMKAKGDLPRDLRFVILDTDGGFDESRLKKLLEYYKLPGKEIIGEMILHYVFFSFSEQHSFIVSQGKSEFEKLVETENVVFITLDPATYFYRQEIINAPSQMKGKKTQEMLGKIDRQLNKLRKLAFVHGTILTVTSWPVSEMMPAFLKLSGKIRMPVRDFIGGDQTMFLAKAIYRIDYIYVPSPDRHGMFEEHPRWRKFTVKKERDVEKGKSCYFSITEKSGIAPLSEGEIQLVEKYEEIIEKFWEEKGRLPKIKKMSQIKK